MDKKLFVIGGEKLYDYIYLKYSFLIESYYITEVDKVFNNIDDLNIFLENPNQYKYL